MANISVVIPIYNEDKSIHMLIKKLMKLKAEPRIDNLEVFFINDGSKDKSLEIIRENIQAHKDFKNNQPFKELWIKRLQLLLVLIMLVMI